MNTFSSRSIRHLPTAWLTIGVLAVVVGILTPPASAAPGDLDLTFGGTGKVITPIGSGIDIGQGAVIQSDGKIVVAGESASGTGTRAPNDFAVARYNADGSLDTTFNGTGKVVTDFGGDDSGYAVAMQTDRKLVVAGQSNISGNYDFALARYTTAGTLDTTFNGTGKVLAALSSSHDAGNSVAIQTDGKIVVAGSSGDGNSTDFAVVRYNVNGTLDTTFNGTGKVTTDFYGDYDSGRSVAIQTDDKIVVAGVSSNGTNGDLAVARYNTNGSLDTTFNGTGKAIIDFGSSDAGYSVKIQKDGKLVVVGGAHIGTVGNIVVVRFNDDGTLDTTFNGTGMVTTTIAGTDATGISVALQSDRKIVVAAQADAGTGRDFAVVRYNTNGSLDTAFNGTGIVTTAVGGGYGFATSVALQSDRKIVVAGGSLDGTAWDFAVVRYLGDTDTDGDGIPDQYETGTGIYVSPEDTGTSPTNSDTDGDGLTDGQEINFYRTDPNRRDTDGDGFEDGFEVSTGFDPASATSTPEAFSVILTAVEYRFNAAAGISYRIEASTDLVNWTTVESPIIGTGGLVSRLYSIQGQPRRFFRSRRN